MMSINLFDVSFPSLVFNQTTDLLYQREDDAYGERNILWGWRHFLRNILYVTGNKNSLSKHDGIVHSSKLRKLYARFNGGRRTETLEIFHGLSCTERKKRHLCVSMQQTDWSVRRTSGKTRNSS